MKCTAATLILAVSCHAAWTGADAQTCAAPGPWHPDLTGAPPTSADTCTLPDSVALYCDFLDSSQKGDAIWQITYAAGFTSTAIAISGGSATFNPVIYLYSSACTLGNQCVSSGDTRTPLPLTGIAPGTYFLGATAAAGDGAGACGLIALSTNGYYPVELQSFDVI